VWKHCAAISSITAEVEISDRNKLFYGILFPEFRFFKITSIGIISAHLKFNEIVDS